MSSITTQTQRSGNGDRETARSLESDALEDFRRGLLNLRRMLRKSLRVRETSCFLKESVSCLDESPRLSVE